MKLSLIAPENFDMLNRKRQLSRPPRTRQMSYPPFIQNLSSPIRVYENITNHLNMTAMYHARSIIENIQYSTLSEKLYITDQVYHKNAVIREIQTL
jgi:hypothetical protein